MIARAVSTRLVFPTLAACLVAAVGCTKLRRGKDAGEDDLPATPVDTTPIAAEKSALGILDLKAELRTDGLLVTVGNVPAGATLECDLDDKPLVPCHDGALFARPTDGDHKITAVALKDGVPVAFGESAPFTVLAGGGLEEDGDPRQSLAVVVTDTTFTNGMPFVISQAFQATFKLAGTPDCQAELRCKYDSRASLFWTECDAGAAGDGSGSFTVPSDLLALGPQYLSVQASCGDRLGPITTLFWYGVPDGYQPLMLKDVQDGHGRHLVELIRDEDCAEGQSRKFECAAKGAADWVQCEGSNTFDSPAEGSRVRLNCDGTIGPELTLVP